MKANEIKTGGVYLMKVSGTVQRVRVDAIRETSDHRGRSRTTYHCTNLATGRKCQARSASKFRGEAKVTEPVKAKVEIVGQTPDGRDIFRAVKAQPTTEIDPACPICHGTGYRGNEACPRGCNRPPSDLREVYERAVRLVKPDTAG